MYGARDWITLVRASAMTCQVNTGSLRITAPEACETAVVPLWPRLTDRVGAAEASVILTCSPEPSSNSITAPRAHGNGLTFVTATEVVVALATAAVVVDSYGSSWRRCRHLVTRSAKATTSLA